MAAMSNCGGRKFGPAIAQNLRAIRPKACTRGLYFDEMVVSLSGRQTWRAVDGEGEVLEILVQPRQQRCDCYENSFAAEGFIERSS